MLVKACLHSLAFSLAALLCFHSFSLLFSTLLERRENEMNGFVLSSLYSLVRVFSHLSSCCSNVWRKLSCYPHAREHIEYRIFATIHEPNTIPGRRRIIQLTLRAVHRATQRISINFSAKLLFCFILAKSCQRIQIKASLNRIESNRARKDNCWTMIIAKWLAPFLSHFLFLARTHGHGSCSIIMARKKTWYEMSWQNKAKWSGVGKMDGVYLFEDESNWRQKVVASSSPSSN